MNKAKLNKEIKRLDEEVRNLQKRNPERNLMQCARIAVTGKNLDIELLEEYSEIIFQRTTTKPRHYDLISSSLQKSTKNNWEEEMMYLYGWIDYQIMMEKYYIEKNINIKK